MISEEVGERVRCCELQPGEHSGPLWETLDHHNGVSCRQRESTKYDSQKRRGSRKRERGKSKGEKGLDSVGQQQQQQEAFC